VEPGELISVIIPAYNRETKIVRAVASVLAQTYENIEVIVVDDASPDGTAAAVEAIGDPRVRLVRHDRNRGAGTARNTGVAAARGEWIAFQDSDDDWLPQKLELQAAMMARLPSDYVAVFCTKIDYGCDEHARYGPRLTCCIPRPDERIESGDLHPRLLRGNIIGPQTALIARKAFLAVGGFDPRLRNNNDWDFFIRLSAHGRIGFLDNPLAVVMYSPDSISRNPTYKMRSFVLVFGKIRRRTSDPGLLADHASAVSSHLRRGGRKKSALLYLRKSISLNPFKPKAYAKYVYTLMK
jgi:glycosyltransferase involved in cell wall biosynthesis